jgi:trehalose 6-phosphate phosphatase
MTLSEALALTASRAAATGFFLDFDGVLAPIQDDPETVAPVPGAASALQRLAGRVRRVAIISARPVEFLRSHFADAPGVALHGLYGLEHIGPDGETVTLPEAEPWVPMMRELAGRARGELPAAVGVEYKRLSVALHYRTAPAAREAVAEWARAQGEARGVRVERGRMVYELRPSIDLDKGTFVRDSIRDLTCAWYFGDDLPDARAFAALSERAAGDPEFAGVRVAVENPETGGELARAADLVLESPYVLPRLLQEVTEALPS